MSEELIDRLIENQQKTLEHLLDQNAQLINLLTSVYMPNTNMPDIKISNDEQVDAAIAGGMNG